MQPQKARASGNDGSKKEHGAVRQRSVSNADNATPEYIGESSGVRRSNTTGGGKSGGLAESLKRRLGSLRRRH